MEIKYNFCCICFEEQQESEPVTDYDIDGVKHCEKLAICDPKQVWEDESLTICKECIGKLNVVFEFIDLCRRSYALRVEKLVQLNDARASECESFTCDLCRKTFKKKRFLKAHITKIHVGRPKEVANSSKTDEKENKHNFNIPTSELPTQDDTKDDVKIELNAINDETYDYFSNNDPATFSSDDEKAFKPKLQRKRRKKGTKPESFTCEYCGKQFNRHQHWSAHIRSKHTFEKPYKCKLCEASFTTSHSLLVHKRNHNNEKPYVCSSCGKKFVCSGDLFHHNKIHLNKKEYECNICNKRFNTTSILRTHKIVKHTEPQNWKYVCLLCDRKFPINSSLTLHMKRHMGVKDQECHICGKKFFNKSEVAKHILSHSNQKRFKCDLCVDKEYKNREGLNKHMKMIHGLGNWKAPKLEKRFLCTLCPKKFIFNNKLQRHLLTHSGQKPFECFYCEKKFSDTYYRKSHMKKEHGEQLQEHNVDEKRDIVNVASEGFG